MSEPLTQSVRLKEDAPVQIVMTMNDFWRLVMMPAFELMLRREGLLQAPEGSGPHD